MGIFVLIAGVVAVLFLLKKDSLNRPGATAGENAAESFGGNVPAYTDFQQKQIDTFGKIATLAGSSVAAASGAIATSGLSLGLTATAWTGIGAAVAAVIVGISLVRGTAHLVANQWVQNVQNPFGAALANIVDAKDASIRDGSASKRSLNLAKTAILNLWGQYQTAAEEFAQQGRDYRTVINQSYATLNPILAQILADIDAQIAGIPSLVTNTGALQSA